MENQKFKIDKKCQWARCPHVTKNQADASECDAICSINNKTQKVELYFFLCNANGQCGKKLREAMLQALSKRTLKNFTVLRHGRGEWSVLP